ncbi:T9SS type A sorting domain-containing protein [candidate division KSB1 bacterium]|nr:T9SS type A sorting domain-containing protein [candidate division KSB1 bacterium]
MRMTILAIGLLLIFGLPAFSQNIDISLPVTNVIQGAAATVPVSVSELGGVVDNNGLGVIAYQLEITFDENVIDAVSASSTGTLTEAWGDPYVNVDDDGIIRVGGFHVNETSGSGVLVNLTFNVVGVENSSTSLEFSVVRFNNGTINTNLTNGSIQVINAVPDPINDLSVVMENATDIRLNWSAPNNAVQYHVYRGTSPFFTPGSSLATVTTTTYLDPGVAGDASVNYYYVVTASNGVEQSDISNRVGVFDYELITTSTTNFNEIALPLNQGGINQASDLIAAVPNCNSVARWNASFQGYEQYISVIPPTNFSINPGFPYYVNVTGNTMFTVVGDYTSPSFNLVTTSTTNFNEIMLPLDRSDIGNASALLAAIPNCNSIARWNALFQGYEQYISVIPPTNFSVRIGYPYYVNITANTIWPSGGMLKVSSPVIVDGETKKQKDVLLKIPHLVYGKIVLPANVSRRDIELKAYRNGSDNVMLTEKSPGSGLAEDGTFWFQCAGFNGGWAADQVVHVEVYHKTRKSIIQQYGCKLSFEPADEAVLVKTVADKNRMTPETAIPQTNYPNPFNAETTIHYVVLENAKVQLDIYNNLGQKIRTLVNSHQQAGQHQAVWDGRNDHAQQVASGFYFYTITINGKQHIQKMLLLQ